MDIERQESTRSRRKRSVSTEHVSTRVLRSRSCTPTKSSLRKVDIKQLKIDNYILGQKGDSVNCGSTNNPKTKETPPVVSDNITKPNPKSQTLLDNSLALRPGINENSQQGELKLQRGATYQRVRNTTDVSKNLKLLNKHDKALACEKRLRTELFVQSLTHAPAATNDNLPFEADTNLVAIVDAFTGPRDIKLAVHQTDNSSPLDDTEGETEIVFNLPNMSNPEAKEVTLADLFAKLNGIEGQLTTVQSTMEKLETTQVSFKQQLDKVETAIGENQKKILKLEETVVDKKQLDNYVKHTELDKVKVTQNLTEKQLKDAIQFQDIRLKELAGEIAYLKAKDTNTCMVLNGIKFQEGETVKFLLQSFFKDVMGIKEANSS